MIRQFLDTSPLYTLFFFVIIMGFVVRNPATRPHRYPFLRALIVVYFYFLYRQNLDVENASLNWTDVFALFTIFAVISPVFVSSNSLDDIIRKNGGLVNKISIVVFALSMLAYSFGLESLKRSGSAVAHGSLLLLPVISIVSITMYYLTTTFSYLSIIFGKFFEIDKDTRSKSYKRRLPAGVIIALIIWRSLYTFSERTTFYTLQSFLPFVMLLLFSLIKGPNRVRYIRMPDITDPNWRTDCNRHKKDLQGNLLKDDKGDLIALPLKELEYCVKFKKGPDPNNKQLRYYNVTDIAKTPLYYEPSEGLEEVQMVKQSKPMLYKTFDKHSWTFILLVIMISAMYFAVIASSKKNILYENTERTFDMRENNMNALFIIAFLVVLFNIYVPGYFWILVNLSILVLNMFSIEMFREFSISAGFRLNQGNRYYQITRFFILLVILYITFKTMENLQFLLEYSDEEPVSVTPKETGSKDPEKPIKRSRMRSTVLYLFVSLILHFTLYSEAVTTWEI